MIIFFLPWPENVWNRPSQPFLDLFQTAPNKALCEKTLTIPSNLFWFVCLYSDNSFTSWIFRSLHKKLFHSLVSVSRRWQIEMLYNMFVFVTSRNAWRKNLECGKCQAFEICRFRLVCSRWRMNKTRNERLKVHYGKLWLCIHHKTRFFCRQISVNRTTLNSWRCQAVTRKNVSRKLKGMKSSKSYAFGSACLRWFPTLPYFFD